MGHAAATSPHDGASVAEQSPETEEQHLGAVARPRLKSGHGPLPADERNTTKQKEAIVATTQEAVQISAIVPTLTVDDLQKSITFYEALGFAIDERWEEKGTLLGVMLLAGRTQIGLNQDDWKKGRDRQKGIGVRLSISTTPGSVDEIAKRARTARITLKSDPHDTEWKSRAFEVAIRAVSC